jgi:hypothetical protein
MAALGVPDADTVAAVFRWGWDKLDAKLVDQKFVRRDSWNAEKGGTWFQVWDYMVELPGPDGRPKRLVIREKTYNLDLPEVGGMVPVLVNRKRTKAAFNLKDPRIDAVGRLKARQKARKRADEERFKEKLGE